MSISRERASIIRGALLNLDNQKMIDFFMNPTELSTTLSVNWNKQQTLGGTYERLHYRGTSNMTFSLELHFNRILYAEHYFRTEAAGQGNTLSAERLKYIRNVFAGYKRFLMALCYPVGNVREVLRRSPPHALLIWPKAMALRVVMTNLSIRDTLFANDGEPYAFTATCSFEEYRTYRLTSREVDTFGLIRSTQGKD